MDVVLYRIDDRLIHGQVMTAWAKFTNANHVIIIDDQVVKDSFMCKILTMAAPRGMQVEIFNLQDGIDKLRKQGDPEKRTIVLMKTPFVALQLVEAGIKLPLLNVGGMGAGPGRKQLFRNISASTEEIEELKKIENLGVPVQFKIVPDDKAVALNKVVK